MNKIPLQVNPVFAGLTRPPMFLGITLDYFLLSCFITISLFIVSDSALYCLIYFPMHLIGLFGCKYDVFFFSIVLKLAECPPVLNKKLWKCQSYEPL
jgi:type IV secretion system protein VirB3